jgi:hypothetical protein
VHRLVLFVPEPAFAGPWRRAQADMRSHPGPSSFLTASPAARLIAKPSRGRFRAISF